MKIADLTITELSRVLRHGNLLLRLGPFVVRLKSDVSSLVEDVALIYADFTVCPDPVFADFHVEVAHESGLRKWLKPQVRFYVDGRPSFIPLPAAQAFAMLEWGLNWCVAAHCHQYLIIHAAVVEKNGKAAMLPAPPGSGKSTLCTGLVMRGWRLLSDELALYDLTSGMVHGMCRPINLKNESIEVIQQFAPSAVMTTRMPDTSKGTVALVRPPVASVTHASQPAQVAWIVLPQYRSDAQAELVAHSRARTFMLIAEQSFNYSIQGERGFEAVGKLVDQSQCFQFTYSRLDDAQRVFDDLSQERTV